LFKAIENIVIHILIISEGYERKVFWFRSIGSESKEGGDPLTVTL